MDTLYYKQNKWVRRDECRRPLVTFHSSTKANKTELNRRSSIPWKTSWKVIPHHFQRKNNLYSCSRVCTLNFIAKYHKFVEENRYIPFHFACFVDTDHLTRTIYFKMINTNSVTYMKEYNSSTKLYTYLRGFGEFDFHNLLLWYLLRILLKPTLVFEFPLLTSQSI